MDLSKENQIFKVPGIHHESAVPNSPFKEVYDVSDKTGKNFPSFQHLPISINKWVFVYISIDKSLEGLPTACAIALDALQRCSALEGEFRDAAVIS